MCLCGWMDGWMDVYPCVCVCVCVCADSPSPPRGGPHAERGGGVPRWRGRVSGDGRPAEDSPHLPLRQGHRTPDHGGQPGELLLLHHDKDKVCVQSQLKDVPAMFLGRYRCFERGQRRKDEFFNSNKVISFSKISFSVNVMNNLFNIIALCYTFQSLLSDISDLVFSLIEIRMYFLQINA